MEPTKDTNLITGIHHVELWLESFERTAALLTERMNHTLIAERSGRFRYGVEDVPGKFVDLLWIPETLRGLDGRGMVHHVAFSTPDTTSLLELKEQLESFGIAPTGVRDRNYFRSIYFREPGGILFEIAGRMHRGRSHIANARIPRIPQKKIKSTCNIHSI